MKKESVLENKDYSYSEGKEFKIVNSHTGDLIGIGAVKGCDYYIGITVVLKHAVNWNCICINGPNSPYVDSRKNYKGAFACLVRKIERGIFMSGTVDKVIHKDKLNFSLPGGPLKCSFSA